MAGAVFVVRLPAAPTGRARTACTARSARAVLPREGALPPRLSGALFQRPYASRPARRPVTRAAAEGGGAASDGGDWDSRPVSMVARGLVQSPFYWMTAQIMLKTIQIVSPNSPYAAILSSIGVRCVGQRALEQVVGSVAVFYLLIWIGHRLGLHENFLFLRGLLITLVAGLSLFAFSIWTSPQFKGAGLRKTRRVMMAAVARGDYLAGGGADDAEADYQRDVQRMRRNEPKLEDEEAAMKPKPLIRGAAPAAR